MPGNRNPKYNTLRKKCKEAGLSALGTRADLIDRLEGHDSAANSYVSCVFVPAGISSPRIASCPSSSSLVCTTSSLSVYGSTLPSSSPSISHIASSSSTYDNNEHEITRSSQHHTASQHVDVQHAANMRYVGKLSHLKLLPSHTNTGNITRSADQTLSCNRQATVMANVSEHYTTNNVDESSCYGTAHRSTYFNPSQHSSVNDNIGQHVYRPRMVNFASDISTDESDTNNNIRKRKNDNITERLDHNTNANNETEQVC